MVNISDLDKAAVLAALYNAARPQGMGFYQYDPTPMTIEQARELLAQSKYFDYLYGRVMKVDLSSDDEFDSRWFDRDNGESVAARVIDYLRETAQVSGGEITAIHTAGRDDAARSALAMF